MTPTCTEFASSWPWAFPRPDERTNDTHASMVKRFAEEFGETPLNEITQREAREFASRHPGHVRYVRTMFNDAIEDKVLTRNPFAKLRVATQNGRRRIVVPTPEQITALVSASSPAFGSMIRFAAYTGLRLGELLALRREDIAGGFVDVRCQLDRRGHAKPPKSGSVGRVLAPTQALPVLSDGAGERLWPYPRSTHWALWDASRRAVGVDFDFHVLRHFCATDLLNRGATAEDVAIQLRHSDGGALVRELYGHPDPMLALERLRTLAA